MGCGRLGESRYEATFHDRLYSMYAPQVSSSSGCKCGD
jgi:hypothetical protein